MVVIISFSYNMTLLKLDNKMR